MRVVVQRVHSASVTVDEQVIGQIEKGYLLYIGIKDTDTLQIVEKVSQKIKNLRIFEDHEGKMNLSLSQVGGSILAISQFTLYGNTKGNNRPSFIEAARPEVANPLYEACVSYLKADFHVETGEFGENMAISSINDGPVTIIIEID